jgi:O-antigen/teichoic acid export membrane protein
MSERSEIGRSSSARRQISTWFSPTNLSRKASLTSLASSLDYVARITVQFVINPLLVGGLGTYLYGAWRVLYSLNGYLWAAGGRSAQALTWVIAHGQGSLSAEEKRRYVGTAMFVWLVFLPLLALVGGLGAWFAPFVLKTPDEYVWGVRAAAALLTADAIALTLLSIPRSALQGENLGYKRMGLSTVLILVGGGFMALAVYLDTGIAGVAVANAAGTVVTGLLFWQVARKHLPWFGIARPSRANVRWFLGLSGWFMGWKFVYELLTAGDVIVLGIFGSVELVTVYTLTKFVTQSLIPLVATVFEGTSPGLGAIIGTGNTQKAVRLRNEIMLFTWLLSTVLGASLLLWNPSFVSLWVGDRFYAGTPAMLLIVVMVMQFIFIGNDARIIDLTLRLRAKVLVGAIAAVTSVVLAAILVRTTDNEILGMCVGIIIGRTILTVAYPLVVGRMLGHPLIAQLRSVPRPAFTTAVLFIAAIWLGERVTAGSWVMLVLSAGVTAVAFVPVAGLLGMTASQRRALYRRLQKVVSGSRDEASGPPSSSSGAS